MLTPLKALPALGLLAVLTPGVQAQLDFITGTVVDAQGLPVSGVNINAINEGSGGRPDIFNDGTDVFGNFTTSVVPGGVYTIEFVPPTPPNLTTEFPNTAVFGTTDMGTVVLGHGVGVSGRCVDSLGLPVAGVNIDVIDSAGNNLPLKGDVTDVFGLFNFGIPTDTTVEVRFDATPVSFKTLASQAFEVDASADVAMGDVLLPDGFSITTIVQGPGGLPVGNTDTDTFDSLTGQKLYTPKDNTTSLGLANVVVPAGTYDFEVCPVLSKGLVGSSQLGVVVAGNVNLGITSLQAGVVLSGTVTDTLGSPLSTIDIDVRDPNTLIKLNTCLDNTDGAGQYQVLIPMGTWEVDFTPPFSMPYGTAKVTPVVVTGNTVVDGTLADCPFSVAYGTGKPGSGGFVPLLSSSGGTPVLGNPHYTVELSNGLAGATAPLLIAFAPGSTPFKGGTLLVDLSFGFFLFNLPMLGPPGVPGAGGLSIPAAVPNDPLLANASLYIQFFVLDAGAGASGIAFSNGMSITYCN